MKLEKDHKCEAWNDSGNCLECGELTIPHEIIRRRYRGRKLIKEYKSLYKRLLRINPFHICSKFKQGFYDNELMCADCGRYGFYKD